jgi:bifunctional polynucleotide phosphatase/kinase
MVIFVGSPASGKSTFWQTYLSKYSRINRDTLKTKEKCYKVA